MKSKIGKHWRDLLHKEFLHGSEFSGDLTVTIKGFNQIKVYSRKEQGEEELGVMEFVEDVKALVLTTRKCQAIEDLYGTGITNDWVGKKITLYTVKEKHFGKDFDVITVKSKIPTLPQLKKGDKKWNDAIKGIEAGTVSVEQILTYYKVEEKDLVELKKIKKK